MKYPHLAARLYNSPLLVDPAKAAVIEQVFRAHLFGEAKPAANPVDYARPEAALGTVRFQNRTDRPYPITEGGVAVISIVGTLVQRGDSLDAMSGLIGYNRIERQLATAIEDPSSKAILLEVDSPGGEANGCFDLAAKIIEARQAKPIWAVANEQAFSAAYALACAAERLVAPPTGLVGSIGVIALHVDQSKRDLQQGYSYTAVFAGARKNDFSSHEPLSDAAQSILQSEVDRLYGIFCAHVARARGISDKAVRATEAGLLNPEVAKAGGFIDDIASFGDTIAALEDKVRTTRITGSTTIAAAAAQPERTTTMEQKDKPAAATEKPAATTQEKPNAEAKSPEAVGAAAQEAERGRISAILNCEEAKGRTGLAQHLALETSTSVDEAKKLLAKAAVEGAKGGELTRAMSTVANPKVGADTDPDQGAGKPKVDTNAIYESRRQQAAKPQH